jgi:hypothetical protein
MSYGINVPERDRKEHFPWLAVPAAHFTNNGAAGSRNARTLRRGTATIWNP